MQLFSLLDHKGRLVRVPALACSAFDCSVWYDRYIISPELPAMLPGQRVALIPLCPWHRERFDDGFLLS